MSFAREALWGLYTRNSDVLIARRCDAKHGREANGFESRRVRRKKLCVREARSSSAVPALRNLDSEKAVKRIRLCGHI